MNDPVDPGDRVNIYRYSTATASGQQTGRTKVEVGCDIEALVELGVPRGIKLPENWLQLENYTLSIIDNGCRLSLRPGDVVEFEGRVFVVKLPRWDPAPQKWLAVMQEQTRKP